jgi:hypothetical protein
VILPGWSDIRVAREYLQCTEQALVRFVAQQKGIFASAKINLLIFMVFLNLA